MDHARLPARWAAAGLLPLLVMGLADPTARAQGDPLADGVTVTVAPFGEPVRPQSGIGVASVEVAYNCNAFARPPGTPAATGRLAADADRPWASPQLAMDRIQFERDPSTCPPGERRSLTTTLAVSVDSSAPAGAIVTVTVRATFDRQGEEVTRSGSSSLAAGYQARVESEAHDVRFVLAPGEEARPTLSVRNLGNDRVHVSFTVTRLTPDRAEGGEVGRFTVEPGPALDLGSTQQGDPRAATEGTWGVRLAAPESRPDVESAVLFRIEGVATRAEGAGEAETFAYDVQVRVQGGNPLLTGNDPVLSGIVYTVYAIGTSPPLLAGTLVALAFLVGLLAFAWRAARAARDGKPPAS